MITRERERAWDLLIFEHKRDITYSVPQLYDIYGIIDHILDYLIVHPLSKPCNN